MNNADLIVSLLKCAGVARGYGVPSGNVLPLMEAMRAAALPFILTAHEGSAAFAADATARVTGKPGLCIATLGPGATNLTTGVGCAYLDRSPLVAITCTLDEAQLGRRLQMAIDHETLFRPITKASFRLQRGAIAETVIEALRIATSEPWGPVHLDLPEDVALAPVSERVPSMGAVATRVIPGTDAETIAKVVECMRRSRRPVAVIGMSAMRMRNPRLLTDFIARHRLPFATTLMAKGLVDEDDPLSLGCIERACRKLQRAFLHEQADLIIALGYDTVEVEYEAWTGSLPVVHVDTQSADADSSVVLLHEAIGDLDATMEALAAIDPITHEWRDADIARQREAFQAALRPALPGFTPHAAIDVVRRQLPCDGVLAFDIGAHTHQIGSQWTAHAPRTFLITNGWSSMGFGLPAAIAAKLARPDLPVVCIVGDGCFEMTCGELTVARRERLAVPFVVLSDRWLSLIKVKQERRGLQHYGTELEAVSPPEPPAHYFGVPVVAARTADELERALMRAFAADGPTVIEATVDPAHYSLTVYD